MTNTRDSKAETIKPFTILFDPEKSTITIPSLNSAIPLDAAEEFLKDLISKKMISILEFNKLTKQITVYICMNLINNIDDNNTAATHKEVELHLETNKITAAGIEFSKDINGNNLIHCMAKSKADCSPIWNYLKKTYGKDLLHLLNTTNSGKENIFHLALLANNRSAFDIISTHTTPVGYKNSLCRLLDEKDNIKHSTPIELLLAYESETDVIPQIQFLLSHYQLAITAIPYLESHRIAILIATILSLPFLKEEEEEKENLLISANITSDIMYVLKTFFPDIGIRAFFSSGSDYCTPFGIASEHLSPKELEVLSKYIDSQHASLSKKELRDCLTIIRRDKQQAQENVNEGIGDYKYNGVEWHKIDQNLAKTIKKLEELIQHHKLTEIVFTPSCIQVTPHNSARVEHNISKTLSTTDAIQFALDFLRQDKEIEEKTRHQIRNTLSGIKSEGLSSHKRITLENIAFSLTDGMAEIDLLSTIVTHLNIIKKLANINDETYEKLKRQLAILMSMTPLKNDQNRKLSSVHTLTIGRFTSYTLCENASGKSIAPQNSPTLSNSATTKESKNSNNSTTTQILLSTQGKAPMPDNKQTTLQSSGATPAISQTPSTTQLGLYPTPNNSSDKKKGKKKGKKKKKTPTTTVATKSFS